MSFCFFWTSFSISERFSGDIASACAASWSCRSLSSFSFAASSACLWSWKSLSFFWIRWPSFVSCVIRPKSKTPIFISSPKAEHAKKAEKTTNAVLGMLLLTCVVLRCSWRSNSSLIRPVRRSRTIRASPCSLLRSRRAGRVLLRRRRSGRTSRPVEPADDFGCDIHRGVMINDLSVLEDERVAPLPCDLLHDPHGLLLEAVARLVELDLPVSLGCFPGELKLVLLQLHLLLQRQAPFRR